MSKMLEIESDKINNENESRRLIRLGDVCSPRNENVSPAEFLESLYVGLEHLDSGDPKLNHFGSSREVNSSKSRFYKGDILYGKLRPYLDKAVLAEIDGICSTDILVIVSEGALALSEYLTLLLHSRSFIDYVVKITQGVNLPRASWSLLTDFEFYLPPLPEQRAIARVLRAVQDAIQARRRELALERERKAALMQHLFTYGTRGECATFETMFGFAPAHWLIQSLEECAYIQTGIAKGRSLEGRIISRPYLRVANVQDGYLDLTEMKEIELLEDEVNRYALHIGDVVVTEGGDFDKLG